VKVPFEENTPRGVKLNIELTTYALDTKIPMCSQLVGASS